MSRQRIGPARAPRPDGRARARDHQLLELLALEHVQRDRRADGLPARVRVRLRLAGLERRRLRLRRLRRHGHGRHRGAVLAAPSPACSGRSSSTSSSAPTTRSSPRRWTPRSSSPPRRCGSRIRAGTYGCAPMLVAMLLRAGPELGHAARPVHRRSSPASAGPTSASRVAARMNSIDNFSYVISAVLTPLFLVAGTFFPIDGLPEWAQVVGAAQPALPPRPARPRRRGLRLRARRPRPPRGARRVRAADLAARPSAGSPAGSIRLERAAPSGTHRVSDGRARGRPAEQRERSRAAACRRPPRRRARARRARRPAPAA